MAILKSLGMNSTNVCMLFLGLIVIVFLLSLFKNTKEYMTSPMSRKTSDINEKYNKKYMDDNMIRNSNA